MPDQHRNRKARPPSHGTGAARREALRRQRQRQERWRKLRLPIMGIVVVAAIAVGLLIISSRSGSKAPAAATNGAFADSTSAAGNAPINGITCDAGEQLAFHIHSHLAVFVNGEAQKIPQGVGVGSSCIYWLHSHTSDGIIHMEAPTERAFTLGDYFAIWGQPLSATQVATATGAVTAYVDGKPFTGNPTTIPLAAHTLVQLDVGTPAPAPVGFDFPSGV
jgi:hypothetical protein